MDAFHRNRHRQDGRQNQCKSCKSNTDKEDYKRNNRKDEAYARRAAQVAALRAYVMDYLAAHPCVDCGNGDWRVLEFDHVRGVKRLAVAEMIQRGYALATVVSEIAKCDIRCANCHRIRTRETLWGVDKLVKSPGSDPGAM